MPDLIPTSAAPLLAPVVYEGQTYFTSQYFHQQYRSNNQHHGKHRRYDSFMRLLHSIEAYALYLDKGDIIEVQWNRDKPHLCGEFQPLFQATGYHPITLLNATAQLAMSHHLDDELSKQMSVTANTVAARRQTSQDILAQYPEMQAIVQQANSVIALAIKTAEVRAIAESAQREATEAKATAARALESQLFFTVAEYICFNKLERQVPKSAYKACSDHLRLYCLDNGIPFRRILVGGKQWDDEYGFHISVYAEAFPGWLMRRYAQVHLVPKEQRHEC